MYLVQVIFIVPLVCDVSDLSKCVQIVRKGVRYSLVVLLALPKWEDPGSIPGVVLDK